MLHWKQTFSNFLYDIKDALEKNKLQLLINYKAPNVYQYISESKTFKEVADILESCVKVTNVINARHCLATGQQYAGESVDQYLQVLKLMSKHCNLKDVTTKQNEN